MLCNCSTDRDEVCQFHPACTVMPMTCFVRGNRFLSVSCMRCRNSNAEREERIARVTPEYAAQECKLMLHLVSKNNIYSVISTSVRVLLLVAFRPRAACGCSGGEVIGVPAGEDMIWSIRSDGRSCGSGRYPDGPAWFSIAI